MTKPFISLIPVIVIIIGCLSPTVLAGDKLSGEPVVLLHGLGRTYRSMLALEKKLAVAGFNAINIDYPSREYPIDKLADIVCDAIEDTDAASADRVNFVTHSLGGILVRWLHGHGRLKTIGRVVMLSPPNHGSEIVDKLTDNPVVDAVMGPAFHQLGTEESNLPASLGPVDFELGVITGTKSLNPLFSDWVPGVDDGKVSTDSAKVDGMQDFLAVSESHAFIMDSTEVFDQVVYFLNHGRFNQPNKPK